MTQKRGLFIYMAGSLMMIAAVFLPYLRYRFVLKGSDKNVLDEMKGSFSLFHINEMKTRFFVGDVSLFTRILIYLVLAAGVLGIAIVLMHFLSHEKHLSIEMLAISLVTPLVGIIANIAIRRDREIQDVVRALRETKKVLMQEGYTGSGGYGVGFFLLLLGMLLTVIGLVLYLKDTEFPWND